MTSPLFNRRHFTASLLPLAAAGFAVAAAPRDRTVLVLGDSLSAEYGLPRGSGWVALMQRELASAYPGTRVVNASISGETTSGGRSRLPALLKQHQPTQVIVELGGNDALRGLPIEMTQDNLAFLLRSSKDAGARVLLLGMQMPPNYGPDMTRRFAALYPALAKQHGAGLVPFFLKGVGDDPDPMRWFQADRIHPNEAAQARLLANVWPELKKLLA
jgi:acyl-CoA thioesterase-1